MAGLQNGSQKNGNGGGRGVEGRPMVVTGGNNALDSLRGQLEKAKPRIAEVVPRHMAADRIIRLALAAASKDEKLQRCTPASVLMATLQLAALGLEPNTPLHQAYLVPYSNRKNIGGRWQSVMEAQPIIGYRGYILMALQGGDVAAVDADVVHAKDHFVARRGLSPVLEHEESQEADPGHLIAAYVVWQTAHGHRQFRHRWRAWLERHRDKFAPRNRDKQIVGPWADQDMFDAMCLKSIIREASKFWGMSSEKLSHTIAIDARGEAGLGPDVSLMPHEPNPQAVREARIALGETPEMLEAPAELPPEAYAEDAEAAARIDRGGEGVVDRGDDPDNY